MHTLAQARTGQQNGRRTVNGHLEVLDAIRADIASLVRSGGKDSAECTRIAVATLAELRRLKWKQALALWQKYA